MDENQKEKLFAYLDASAELEGNPVEAEEYRQREIREMQETVTYLENKFIDAGLKFTVPFSGAMPVQAFGYLHGQRFYFRFRRDTASLRVGFHDIEGEEAMRQRDIARRTARLEKIAKQKETGELSGDELMQAEFTANSLVQDKVDPDSAYLYPTWITEEASWDSVTGEAYAGILNATEAGRVFTTLMDALEPCNIRYADNMIDHTPAPQ